MVSEVHKNTESRMAKSIEALQTDLAKLRTGRANSSLLEQITVDYYGQETPLNQVASVTVADARTLAVNPWEKTMVPVIEKAIMKADLGLNPTTVGQVIRVPLPPVTEERRKELVKVVKSEAENGRIAIRNIRRDANSQFKELLKSKEITEDEERRAQEQVQKVTDRYISEVDKCVTTKEAELMEF